MDLNDPQITSPLLQRVMRIAAEEQPTIQYRFKNEIWWWKVAYYAIIWIFNREFMVKYTTTLDNQIHFPSRKWLLENQASAAGVIAHELVHMRNNKARGSFVAGMLYFFPQDLAVLAPLAILGVWIPELTVFLLFVLALAPIPAYWRMEEEMSAYRMSIAFQYWRDGWMHDSYISEYAKPFIGSGYYFMWPFRKQVEGRLRRYLSEVRSGEVRKDPLFDKMYLAIQEG